MTRHLRILFAALTLALAASMPAASQTSLKVSLDSAYLLMGKTTPLHIELIKPADAEGALLIPADTIADKVEILRALEADTSDIRNGRVEIRQDLTLQSFDSGTYILSPIRYVQGNSPPFTTMPMWPMSTADSSTICPTFLPITDCGFLPSS